MTNSLWRTRILQLLKEYEIKNKNVIISYKFSAPDSYDEWTFHLYANITKIKDLDLSQSIKGNK